MIVKRLKEITAIVKQGKIIAEVRKGTLLVWQAVRSCFGSGIWRSEKPWIGNEKWKGSK